ncbi:MAG: tetratricopeptide repeat protein [Anaerolineales bacterium]
MGTNESPEVKPRHGKSFGENLDILFNEIVLAAQWGRPSLLLAVNKSTLGQEKAEQALEARLKERGMEIARIVVNEQRFDVADVILRRGAEPVYFVSNLNWGGGDDGSRAFHGLNLKRELFVEHRIRAVFWLTNAEAVNLAKHAPDFWAFRHRVVEFISPRGKGSIKLPSGVLLWDQQTAVDIFDSPQAAIRARQELLEKLPDNPESLSARVELHYSIAYLRWAVGDETGASEALAAGLELAGGHDLPELRSRLLNATGILRYGAGEFDEALDQFSQGIRLRPSSTSLLVNYAAASCMVGRKQEAMQIGQKVLAARAPHAESLQRLAYVQAAVGRANEAIRTVQKAIESAPTVWRFHATLAVLYTIVDRLDETRRELEEARKVAGTNASWYLDIIQAAVAGEADEPYRLLRSAVQAKHLTRVDIGRDANLVILLEEDRLAEFAA